MTLPRASACARWRAKSTGYAHATELSEDAMKRAAASVQAVKSGHVGVLAGAPARTNIHLYTDESPLDSAPFDAKVKLMADIDAFARSRDARVRQVSCSLAGEWQAVEIIRAGGEAYRDVRPLVRLSINIVVEENGRQESGYYGGGGRRLTHITSIRIIGKRVSTRRCARRW